MSEFLVPIRVAHVICVCLSGSLFAVRGLLSLTGIPGANRWAVRWLSYAIDTGLLTAALMLVTIEHQYPFVQGWLTTKVVLLVVYLALGSFALHWGRTRTLRLASYSAALLVFLFIVSVAYWHDPAGVFRHLVTFPSS
jgi:uncharacterized membrane protein SirB2